MSRRGAQQRRDAARQRRNSALGLLAIIVLAVVIRFWQLDQLPPGLYHDEAYNGLDALALVAGETFPQHYEGWELYAADAHAEREAVPTPFPLFFEGNYGREPLHVYLMALSIRLFGATPFAIRAVPAAAGVLSVLTTFFAAQALLGNVPWEPRNSVQDGKRATAAPFTWHGSVSLLAAFTVAILYPAITFSRFGIRAMLFVPFETLSVTFFWYGMQLTDDAVDTAAAKRNIWFLLAGVFLGLGVYTYAAARVLPLLFALFIPVWFWLRPEARRSWRAVALMAGSAFITALPLLYFFIQYPYFFVFRTGFVANKGLGTFPGRPWLTWLNNVGRVVRGFFWQGETHLRHNLPGRPYLDPIQAVFFVLGIISALATWNRPQRLRSLFLLIWLVVMLFPTILSGDAPHFGRMTGAVGPVAILIALGATWLWQRMVDRMYRANRDGRRLATLVIALGFLLSGALALGDYFGRYANHPELAHDFYLADWQLGVDAVAEPDATVLFLSPTQEEMATIYFALGGDIRRLADYNGELGVVPAGIPGRPSLYYLRPTEGNSLARLQEFFPTGIVGEAIVETIPFRVPANAPRLPGVNPTDVGFQEQDREAIALVDWTAVVEDEMLFLTLYWQATGEINKSYTAFVHILDEAGNLLGQLDRPPAGFPTQDWRTGEIIADQFVLQLPANMAAASYLLQTGFYQSETLMPLGGPVTLGRLVIGGEP